MSALAQFLLDTGNRVSGSDRSRDQGVPLPVLDVLARAGVKLVPQNGSGITNPSTVVVVSTAIEEGNPDLVRAQGMGCRIVHRAALLAEMTVGRKLIAVSGTSGKTTVTGMIGWIMSDLGWDPTVINGGAVIAWATRERVGSVRRGHSDWYVVEADESDRSLLGFRPIWAVITNQSADHFSMRDTEALFSRFAACATEGVIWGPDFLTTAEGASSGIQDGGRDAFMPEQQKGRWGFRYRGVHFIVPGLGRHNAENGWIAARTCVALGMAPAAVAEALRTFPGIERRLQIVGTSSGITVIDDYAHNPAKIRASWSAVASSFRGRVLGVWRPHGFTPLRNMMNELVNAFCDLCREQDLLYLLPVYYAGGTAERSVTSEDLAARLRTQGIPAQIARDYEELFARLNSEARAGDTILCMGARDPELPLFARRLVAQWESPPWS